MRLLSSWGMVEIDDTLLPPGERVIEPDRAEISAAEACWNMPPPAYVTTRSTSPPVPPVPAEHAEFLARIAVLANADLARTHSTERADTRLLWVAVVRGEAARKLVELVAAACDALIAAGEVEAEDGRIKQLREIRVEPSPSNFYS